MSASLVVSSNIGGCNEIVLHGLTAIVFKRSPLNWLISWFVYGKAELMQSLSVSLKNFPNATFRPQYSMI